MKSLGDDWFCIRGNSSVPFYINAEEKQGTVEFDQFECSDDVPGSVQSAEGQCLIISCQFNDAVYTVCHGIITIFIACSRKILRDISNCNGYFWINGNSHCTCDFEQFERGVGQPAMSEMDSYS